MIKTIIRDDHHEVVKKSKNTGAHTVVDVGDVSPHNVTTRSVGGWFPYMLLDGKIAIADSKGDVGIRMPIEPR